MRLKNGVNVTELMQSIALCKSNVNFSTKDSDVLNLKSVLAQYIFASLVMNEDFLYSSSINCDDEDDIPLILPFCVEE